MNRRDVCKILASIPFFGIKPINDLYEYIPSDYKIIEYHLNTKGYVSFKESYLSSDYDQWFIPMNKDKQTKKDFLNLIKAAEKDGCKKVLHVLFYNGDSYGMVMSGNDIEISNYSKQFLERMICVQS